MMWAISGRSSGRTASLPVRRRSVTSPYRIALLPSTTDPIKDPAVVMKGTQSVSAAIMNPPVAPVLADGVFAHTAPLAGMQTIDVMIPNVACPKCALQVIEFMAEHGAPFFYHHCAELEVTADGASSPDAGSDPVDAGAGTGGTGGGGGSGGGSGSGGTGGASATGGAGEPARAAQSRGARAARARAARAARRPGATAARAATAATHRRAAAAQSPAAITPRPCWAAGFSRSWRW